MSPTDAHHATIRAALEVARGKLTQFAPEYTIAPTGNETGPMWKPHNLTQPKIDTIDAALAWLDTLDAGPINAISYILDNILWDYNSPLGEAASAVRSWLLLRHRPATGEPAT